MPRRQKRKAWWIQGIGGGLGLVLSLLLASTAFVHWSWASGALHVEPRFSFGLFVRTVPHQLYWLLPFMILSAAIIPLRAMQWQRTLSRPVPFSERYHLVAIGALVHNALPGKLGDVTRSFLMARSQHMPFFRSLGSVMVCKLLEFCALLLLVTACLLGPFRGWTDQFRTALRVAGPLCVVLVVTVVLMARYAGALAEALNRRSLFPRLQNFLREVGEGLGTARSLRGMASALAFSVLPVLSSSAAYGVGLWALGIPHGQFAGPLVLGAIALGQTAIGVPTDIGIYYFLTSWTARQLGADADAAAAFAALTHLGTVLSQISVGGLSLWARKIRWQDLRRRSHLAAEAARDAETLEPARA
jgi:hypothetical protein